MGQYVDRSLAGEYEAVGTLRRRVWLWLCTLAVTLVVLLVLIGLEAGVRVLSTRRRAGA